MSDEQRQKIRNMRSAKKAKQEVDRGSQISSLTTQDSAGGGGANNSSVSASTNGSTDPVNPPGGSAKRG